jgi:lipoprotein-releasing system ATP-binding protein
MIEIRGIKKSFGALEVLKGIDLNIERGKIVSIVGPSGAGKTTLLQIMGTLDKPDQGSITYETEEGKWVIDASKSNFQSSIFNKKDISAFRNKHMGFVFQFHQLLPEFTALENVMMPALIGGVSRREAKRRAEELLAFMGLSDRASHKPNELSGGEKQRVAVARALVNKPDVVFADEPSGSLDSHNKEELHRLFFDLRDKMGQTFVIVTHDEQLADLADRKIFMQDGRIVE